MAIAASNIRISLHIAIGMEYGMSSGGSDGKPMPIADEQSSSVVMSSLDFGESGRMAAVISLLEHEGECAAGCPFRGAQIKDSRNVLRVAEIAGLLFPGSMRL